MVNGELTRCDRACRGAAVVLVIGSPLRGTTRGEVTAHTAADKRGGEVESNGHMMRKKVSILRD